MKIDVARILGIVAVVGVVGVLGCREKAQLQVPKAARVAERTKAPALLSPAPLEVVGYTSPILMVWRDPTTGKFASRTLPPETKASVAAAPAGVSSNLLVAIKLPVAIQTIVAVE